NERPSVNESDLVARSLEEPQIAVAANIDQALIHPAAALEIDQDRRRDFIPIPRFVGIVLMMTLDLARCDIEGNCRRRVQIVAGALVADPWTAVSRSDQNEVGFRIVI